MRCLIVLVSLLLSAPVWGCGPLRLAYFDYPGLYARDAQGMERGFDVDTVREVAARSGCRFETQKLSVIKAWQALENGQLDIVVSLLRTPERERHAEFAVFLGSTASLVMMPRDISWPDLTPERFDNEAQLRLIVVRGARFGEQISRWIEQLRLQGRVSEAGDMVAALRAFEAGRAQALVVHPIALAGREPAWLARQRLYNWWPDEPAFGGWALSRHSMQAADRRRVLDALETLRRDGSLHRLAEKALGVELARHWVLAH